jgi:cysteine desulfurase
LPDLSQGLTAPVNTSDNALGPVYLDNNATTPLDPRVLEAMVRVWRDCGANPASQHSLGRRARRLVEDAREGIVALLGGQTTGMAADRLVFTSGGTEANHLALHGLLRAERRSQGLAISPLEHASIQGTAEFLRQQGYPLDRLPVLNSGVTDLAAVEAILKRAEPQRPQLISLMLASNETGVLQPVQEVCRLAAGPGTLVHSDAVQGIGKVPVHFRELGLAAMTIAPHKFHGPLGVGGLLLRSDVQLQPQMFGAFQQGSLRPGTENAPLAVGFFTAVKICHDESANRRELMSTLRNELQATLQKQIPNSVIIGEHVPRNPNTLCISFPGLDRQALVMALDLAGVACSTGSACASGSSEPSPSLLAMGLPPEVAGSAIRFSVGVFNTAAEIAAASERISTAVNKLRQSR